MPPGLQEKLSEALQLTHWTPAGQERGSSRSVRTPHVQGGFQVQAESGKPGHLSILMLTLRLPDVLFSLRPITCTAAGAKHCSDVSPRGAMRRWRGYRAVARGSMSYPINGSHGKL